MENKKTVAERLRKASKSGKCEWLSLYRAVTGEMFDCRKAKCKHCFRFVCRELANVIEAEQAELRERVDELNSTFIDLASLDLLCEKLDMSPDLRGIAEQIRAATKPMKRPQRHHEVDVDVDTLLKVANSIEYEAQRKTGVSIIPATQLSLWVGYIRDAVKGATFEQAKPQLPEGVEWPRFDDGELVKFGDEFYHDGITDTVEQFTFREAGFWVYGNGVPAWELYSWGEPVKRPEPDVLDADGVPIMVGDTVWYGGKELVVKSIHANEYCAEGEEPEHLVWCGEYVKDTYPLHHIADQLTHRKPDTFESVAAEMLAEIDGNDNGPEIDGYLARFRKLMGGE